MKILISNDDGWAAPGIIALAEALQSFADIKVVAPDRNRSAASSSLTLMNPIRAVQQRPDWYSVDGTPADCVILAFNGLIEWVPDIVVSGINAGPNLGDDVVYSGTVAAALEGFFHGIPGYAFSLTDPGAGYAVAADIAADLIKRLALNTESVPGVMNVNIPRLASAQNVAVRVTRLGRRGRSSSDIETADPRGEKIYWIGAVGTPQDNVEGTDFHAINNGEVSITPLSYDMTAHNLLAPLSHTLFGDAV